MRSIAARRLAARYTTAGLVAIALATGTQFAVTGAQASVASSRPVANPYSPAYGHGYRHGVVPTVGRLQEMRGWARSHVVHATSSNNLNYGGGISGVGVTTGPEKVYLVFWGSQWGTQGTDGSGYATFSGDPQAVAPDLQAFFKGLGTGSDTWSGVMTQYCQGVAVGAQTCPASAAHVGYPAGGALAGVWEDNSGAAPSAASGHQIAVEAEKAATHFGNTTAATNRDAQYVIVSPTGTDPDNYETQGFCAWHDYTGDSTLDGGGGATGPLLAFTNLPYIPDAGASCGAGFVNAGNNLDGVTIVDGHEYAETITDQFPAGGWIDNIGEETGDKCAWISSGQGAAQNISLTTGSFAVQSTWANDFNSGAGGCEVSHHVLTVTAVKASPVPSLVGGTVTYTATVSPNDGGGTVTFSDNGTTITACANLSLTAAAAGCQAAETAVGTHQIKAVYSGDASFGGSQATINHHVTYALKRLYNPATVHPSGSSFYLSLQLNNAAGQDVSASGIVLTVAGLSPSPAPGTAPSGTFTFIPASGTVTAHYRLLVQSTSYPANNYTLSFTATGDPVTHTLKFIIG